MHHRSSPTTVGTVPPRWHGARSRLIPRNTKLVPPRTEPAVLAVLRERSRPRGRV